MGALEDFGCASESNRWGSECLARDLQAYARTAHDVYLSKVSARVHVWRNGKLDYASVSPAGKVACTSTWSLSVKSVLRCILQQASLRVLVWRSCPGTTKDLKS